MATTPTPLGADLATRLRDQLARTTAAADKVNQAAAQAAAQATAEGTPPAGTDAAQNPLASGRP